MIPGGQERAAEHHRDPLPPATHRRGLATPRPSDGEPPTAPAPAPHLVYGIGLAADDNRGGAAPAPPALTPMSPAEHSSECP